MTLKLGFIGCGRHARHMLMPQLARNGMRLEAVCDIDEAAAATVAADYGAKAAYARHDDLIAHKGLDAVAMAVGPAVHEAAAIAALSQGLAVFMEKPPAADLAGAERVAEAAERAGRPVLVGFMKRYSTGNRMAKNVLEGDFGPVSGVVATYMTAPTYFGGAADYSGFYLHHCVHAMDLVPWLTGSDMTDMTVRVREPAPGRILFHLSFGGDGGIVGTVVMGTLQSRGTPVERIEIMGDHKRLTVDNVVNVTYHRDPPFKADDLAATLHESADTLSWTPNFTAAANEDFKGYNALLADAAAALRGEKSTAPTITDGVAAMGRLQRMRTLIEDAIRR